MIRYDIDNNKETIIELINSGTSGAEICRMFGCKHSTLKSRLDKWGIKLETKHFQPTPYIPAMEYINSKKSISTLILKKKLWKDGLKEKKCEICLITKWLDQPAPLELHHIDGDRYNNKLENIQILCANCHRMTDNHSGKNKGRKIFCMDCGIEISKKSKRCQSCNSKVPKRGNRKVERPSKEELSILVWETPTTILAERFGVTDSAIGKWCKEYGIEKPPRGYWAKLK